MDETTIEIIKAVICFIIVILFAVLTYVISIGREVQKMRTLEKISRELRFSFIGNYELGDRELYQFDIFKKNGRKAVNVLRGVRRWIKYRIFDYTYLAGEFMSTTQTVIVAELDRIDLPGFILKPRDFLYVFKKKSGYRVIECENFPEFSRNYILGCINADHSVNNRKKHSKKTILSTVQTIVSRRSGIPGWACHPLFTNIFKKPSRKTNGAANPNLVRRHSGILGCECHSPFEEKIRKLFTPRLLKYFQDTTIGFTIEGEGNTLIFYRPGRKVRVHMMNDFIKKAMEIAHLFNRERF